MMGSANGYTDCVCHFTDHSTADHFMMEWAKANSTQTQFTNVQVVRKHADPNGYFLIGTEYGDCYISAGKLKLSGANETSTRRTITAPSK